MPEPNADVAPKANIAIKVTVVTIRVWAIRVRILFYRPDHTTGPARFL
jgi:hypothetical protein